MTTKITRLVDLIKSGEEIRQFVTVDGVIVRKPVPESLILNLRERFVLFSEESNFGTMEEFQQGLAALQSKAVNWSSVIEISFDSVATPDKAFLKGHRNAVYDRQSGGFQRAGFFD